MMAGWIAAAAAVLAFAPCLARVAIGPGRGDRILGACGAWLCLTVATAALGAATASLALLDVALVASLAAGGVASVAASAQEEA